MKRLLLLTAIFLTACGPTSEEKQGIATIACNVMENMSSKDGARIKEVNAARQSMGEEPFLMTDDVIHESFEYELCEELVLNNPNYGGLLTSEKEKEDARFNKVLEDVWFSKYFDEPDGESFVLTAKFIDQKFIVTFWGFGPEQEQSYDYIAIDNSTIEIRLKDDAAVWIVAIDHERESFSFPIPGMVGDDDFAFTFTRPPTISLAQWQGVWHSSSSAWAVGVQTPSGIEQYQMMTLSNSSSVRTRNQLTINHLQKSFQRYNSSCDIRLDYGFIVSEKCGNEFSPRFIMASTDDSITLRFAFDGLGEYDEELTKVSDDYQLPNPPDGYDHTTILPDDE